MRTLWMVLLAAAGLIFGGCYSGSVNVNANPDAWANYGMRKADEGMAKLDRSQAIRLAKDTAIQNGLTEDDIDHYDVNATGGGEKSWWVTFDRRRASGAKRWPTNFAVRIDSKGNAVLYKNPELKPRGDD